MASNSAYSVFNTSYTNRVSYLTAAEYMSAPTAMDTGNLVPGGSAAAQLTALNETIARASSWIDQYCTGAWGTLCATVETENARVWGTNRGTLPIHPKYWPILEVQTFSYSPQSAGVSAATASIVPSGSVWIEPQQFIVQPAGVVGLGFNGGGGIVNGVQYYCEWQYVNGWPTSTLSASVAAAAASIAPSSVVGIYPGTTLTIYDEPYNELIQVTSSYVPGTAAVTLTANLAYTHASGVMVSNLPPAVKQAAILATTGFIKQRGSGALVVADMGATTTQQKGFSQNAGSDWAEAKELLGAFKSIFVGY